MSKEPAGGRSIDEVLDLLKDPKFCAEAARTITEAAGIAAQVSSFKEGRFQIEQLGVRFIERWGVLPPTSGELLDPDPRRRCVEAIVSGRWGVVPIFPWTTNRQIKARVVNMRPVIRKQHRDALVNRHAQLVGWLEAIGFDRPTIAHAVFGRTTGLRRPTQATAIARTPERRERELYEEYRGLGLTHSQIQQKVYRRLQGSEAVASAAVRMTDRR